MNAKNKNTTRTDSLGAWHAIAFFIVAIIVGLPSFLLGGFPVGYLAFLLFGILFVVFFAEKKRRFSLVVYLFLAIGLPVGWLASVPQIGREIAIQASDWLLFGPQIKHIAVRVIVAIVAGAASGMLIVILPLWLIVFISAEWMLALRETYGLDRKLAFSLMLNLALGIGEAKVIVDEGEIKGREPKGPLDKVGAPAVVVVKPYNAVVLERGTKVSRIEGPGILRLQKGEEIKAVVDLRPQGGGFEREALTQDNVPLRIKGGVSFRIEPWKEARDRGDAGDLETKDFTGIISGPYPVYQRTIYRAVYGVPAGKDWQSQTKGTAGGRVGRAIQSFRIDEIFVVDEDKRVNLERTALQEILDQARTGAIEAARSWGVSVAGVGVSDIEMPEDVQNEFLQRWGAPWRGWQTLMETETKRRKAFIEAESKQEMAMLQANANVTRAQARAAARRIQAEADAEAEAVFFHKLAQALVKTLDSAQVKEILIELAKQKIGLKQMQILLRTVNPSHLIIPGIEGFITRLNQGTEETEDADESA